MVYESKGPVVRQVPYCFIKTVKGAVAPSYLSLKSFEYTY